MITLAQRIEELRTQRGMSRPGLSAALGLPKNAIEKFETGRQTPNQEQQEKLAAYFGVSIFYLRGESDDRTRQESWLEGAYQEDPVQSEFRPVCGRRGNCVRFLPAKCSLSGAGADDGTRSAPLSRRAGALVSDCPSGAGQTELKAL